MIDLGLNELPVDPEDEIANASAQRAAQGTQPRAGLSINDTVAANANLSVGSRGVDTSGVRAGAGAGAGSTTLNAGAAGESPMPQVVPGPRGPGTTALGSSTTLASAGTMPSSKPEEVSELRGFEAEDDPTDISARAYQCWCDRGCPVGSPEVDWDRAVAEHRASRSSSTMRFTAQAGGGA